jgi:hypothetical protein
MFMIQLTLSPSFWKDFSRHRLAAVYAPLIRALQARGAATTIVKVQAHAGQRLNTIADRLAQQGSESELPPTYSYEDGKNHTIDVRTKGEVEAILPVSHSIVQTLLRTSLDATRLAEQQKSSRATTDRINKPGLGRIYLTKAFLNTRDTVGRRLLQCWLGTLPTQQWLHTVRLATSPHCLLCKHPVETVAHIQSSCANLHNAITKAHDDVWAATWQAIGEVLDPRWHRLYETTLKDSPLAIIPGPEGGNRRPDGIIYSTIKDAHPARHYLILDFTRCSGTSIDNLHEARMRKEDKYREVIKCLQAQNPGDTISFWGLPISYNGTLDERHWRTFLSSMDVTEKHQTKILQKVVLATAEAFSFVIDVRKQALSHLGGGVAGT